MSANIPNISSIHNSITELPYRTMHTIRSGNMPYRRLLLDVQDASIRMSSQFIRLRTSIQFFMNDTILEIF